MLITLKTENNCSDKSPVELCRKLRYAENSFRRMRTAAERALYWLLNNSTDKIYDYEKSLDSTNKNAVITYDLEKKLFGWPVCEQLFDLNLLIRETDLRAIPAILKLARKEAVLGLNGQCNDPAAATDSLKEGDDMFASLELDINMDAQEFNDGYLVVKDVYDRYLEAFRICLGV